MAKFIYDAMKTWLAAAMLHGDEVPPYRKENAPEGCERVAVFVETDENYIVDGPLSRQPKQHVSSACRRGASPTCSTLEYLTGTATDGALTSQRRASKQEWQTPRKRDGLARRPFRHRLGNVPDARRPRARVLQHQRAMSSAKARIAAQPPPLGARTATCGAKRCAGSRGFLRPRANYSLNIEVNYLLMYN